MSDDLKSRIGNLWSGFRKKASDVVAQQGIGLVRGRVAAKDVTDDAGNVLVGAGHRVDDAAIERVNAAGKMPALVAAVTTARTQDLQERIKAGYEDTSEGQGARNLADSEQYLEARNYIQYVAAIEVTDIRGAILVPAGKVIEDEDVRTVREAGQLAALIYSAQQSGPPLRVVDQVGFNAPSTEQTAQRRRTAVPLGETYEEEP